MTSLSDRPHHWAVLAQHGVLRLLLVVTGIGLLLPGVLLSGSVVFLPLGMVLVLMAVGVIAWGIAGEPFESHPAYEATPAIAGTLLHTPWDCRWTRLGYRLTSVAEKEQPETAWVCVRGGSRRSVTDADCAHCPHWEPAPRLTLRHAA
jgi:hypothetical protein